jgi:hypothetical protein
VTLQTEVIETKITILNDTDAQSYQEARANAFSFLVRIYCKTFWDGESTLLWVLQKVTEENHSRFFFSLH